VLTNALYDTWWHGGFRTAPYFHNSIGILSEAASARLMTPITVTTDQLTRSNTRGMRSATEATTNFPDPWPASTWRPRNIMDMELIAARGILSLAAKYRTDYLRNFYELGRKNVQQSFQPNQPIAYLIPAGLSRDEAVAKLVSTLINQGVEVFRLDKELHASYGPQILQRTNQATDKLGTYRSIIANTTSMQEVPAGSYIVFLSQPQRTNVLALFEPQIYPNRLTPTGEAERPYDVAGWTLPLQLGVEAPAVLSIREDTADRKLTLLKDENEVRADLALPLRKSDSSPIKNPIAKPVRIGIYKGSIGNMDEGWTRYIFDTFNVPYSSLKDADLRQGALINRYDVIVLPSERRRDNSESNAASSLPSESTGGMDESRVADWKEFVNGGGTLICFDGSCQFAIEQFHLPIKNVLEGVKSSEFYCPGSIVSLELDTKNPVAATLPTTIPGYFINSSAFATTDPNVRVVARYAKDNVLRSGWLLGEDKLRGQIALAEVPVGKGRIILFAFRPQHRGQTWATLPLIWNSIALASNKYPI